MKNNNSRKLILSMQMSFDGIVAADDDVPEGRDDVSVETVDYTELWEHMFNDLQSVDTVMVGRNMYPGYSDYWRSQLNNAKGDPNEVKYAKWANQVPHIVISKTLQSVDWENTRIARDPDAEIASLKQQPGKDIIVWGGANFAGYLISKRLVDEFRITLTPNIAGKGKDLFANVHDRHKLTLIDTRPLKSGLVILRYKA